MGLFATDVDDIKYVINFDYPNSSEDYVHRIGRTARASKRGTSYTFFTIANARQAKDLIEVLKEAKQQVNPKLHQLQGVASAFTGRCNLLSFVLCPVILTKHVVFLAQRMKVYWVQKSDIRVTNCGSCHVV